MTSVTAAIAPSATAAPLAAPLIREREDSPALETHDLARHYGGLRAVDGVSFAVRSNSIHAVIGPNGAGKSTLFKMLLDEVSRQRVKSDCMAAVSPASVQHEPHSSASARATSSITCSWNSVPGRTFGSLRWPAGEGRFVSMCCGAPNSIAEVERQIDAVLATMELNERAELPAHSLAYGEKRRLEIGLALATGPNVLLLDEPLAGMSPAERTSTRALIRQIGRDRTLLIVEHDMDAIFELAERITVLYEGRLLAEGSPDEIQRNQAVQDAYLGGMREHEPA